jgi:hypothetical protein
MSERLVFELQAIDRATAPLKAVQAQVGATAKSVDAASASMGRFAQQSAIANRESQRFFRGALQQAGYQLGDFAVQVANGTNAVQAFGQQGAQMAGVFGPIGAVLGAVVAIGSALYVAFERATSASDGLSQSANNQTIAMNNLSGAIDETIQKLNEYRFGGSATEFAKNEIENIRSQVQGLRELLAGLRATETSGGSTGLEQIKAMFARDAAIEEFKTRKEALRVLEEKLQVLEAYNEAQRMLNGGLSVQAGISAGLVYDKQVELRAAKEAAKAAEQAAITDRYRTDVFHALAGETASVSMHMSEAFKSGLGLSQIDVSSGIAAAANSAARLAKDLGISLNAAQKMLQLGYQGRGQPVLDPRDPRYNEGAAMRASNFGFTYDRSYGNDTASAASRGAGGGGAMDPLKRLREQIDLERQLIGMTEAKQQVIKSLGDDWQKYDMSVIDGLAQQISEMEKFKQIGSTIKESFSKAFMSMVDGTKSVKDAFKEMARNIIMELYEVLVVKQLVAGVTGAFGKAFPVLGKALGFMADGGTMQANRPYIVGERGPELMVPGRSSAVISNDRLGGGGAVIVNQTINVSTGVQQTVRAEIKSLMPQIADSAKAAVFDAQRRSVNGMGFA